MSPRRLAAGTSATSLSAPLAASARSAAALSGTPPGGASTPGAAGAEVAAGESSRLQLLSERQRAATEGLKALSAEDSKLREKLRTAHAELYDNILREETQRVVMMLQEAQDDDGEGVAQKELIRRVRNMVASGGNLESAQKMIVDELVGQSQEEVQKRVLEAFLPMRFEAEGSLYTKRLALVHELEAVEAQAMALKGGTLMEDAKVLGLKFGMAEEARRTLRSSPPGGASQAKTPGAASSVHPGGVGGGAESPRSTISMVPLYGGGPALTQSRAAASGCASGYASGRTTPRSQAIHSPHRAHFDCGPTTSLPAGVGSHHLGAAAGAPPPQVVTTPRATGIIAVGTPRGGGGGSIGFVHGGDTPGGGRSVVAAAASEGSLSGSPVSASFSAADGSPSAAFAPCSVAAGGSPAAATASPSSSQGCGGVELIGTSTFGCASPHGAAVSPVSLTATHGFIAPDDVTPPPQTLPAASSSSALPTTSASIPAGEGGEDVYLATPATEAESPDARRDAAAASFAAAEAATRAGAATMVTTAATPPTMSAGQAVLSPRGDLRSGPGLPIGQLSMLQAAPAQGAPLVAPLSARGAPNGLAAATTSAVAAATASVSALQQQRPQVQMQVLSPRGGAPTPLLAAPGAAAAATPTSSGALLRAQAGAPTANAPTAMTPQQVPGQSFQRLGAAVQMGGAPQSMGQPQVIPAAPATWGN